MLLHFHEVNHRPEVIAKVLSARGAHTADCNLFRHLLVYSIFERPKIRITMKIDNNLVDRLAELSKLEFEPADKEKIQEDLQKILDLVEKLAEVNVEGVEPLIYMTDERNVLRKDEVKDMVSKEDALSNAPQKDSDYFRVPKVIKK
jgi:aspartyl-tRNA(Asn)/glutamyl-tRNA(Gln) amidotransferase subunit C